MNVYDVINAKIIELLEQGQLPPWKKSWNAQSNYPKNLISKKPYRGINVWLTICQNYDSPYWLTYKQATELGGYIKKGMKSTPVIYFQMLDRNDSVVDGDTSTTGKIPLLKYYSVFNVEQTENVPVPDVEETHNTFDPITRAEKIVADMPQKPDIRFGGNRAYYSVNHDYIQLPQPHTFDSPEELANTTFHELIHSTMHESRLNRKASINIHNFGIEEKSKEELVAEMGAAHLCGHCGIENTTIENSAAYIGGWLKALKNDKTLLIHSASLAQKAADYILNITHQEDQSE
jgi:antirestriction protein ArdC